MVHVVQNPGNESAAKPVARGKCVLIAGLSVLFIGLSFAAPGTSPGHQSVFVAVSPAIVTLGASQTQAMSAAISGQTDQAVNWSLSPPVGSISIAGVYTAPPAITNVQVVTVTATSVANSTITASASIVLNPVVSVSVSPSATSLTTGQNQQFTPVVSGTLNAGVSWSLSPQVGFISSTGLYSAPGLIDSQQTIRVTATSLADPSKSASASILLTPVVGVTLQPTSATLQPGQFQNFVANLIGTSNLAMTWSLDPPLGAITSTGLYAAPSAVDVQRVVTVTAVSVADPTKWATATITLLPAVSLSVTPSCVELTQSQSWQFQSSVVGSNNQAINWSVTPPVGTITSTGLYTAPATIIVSQQVTVSAVSAANANQSAYSTLLLVKPSDVGVVSGCHSVTLSWTASVSPNIAGYNVFRSTQSGGPYTKISPAPSPGTTFQDPTVFPGQTYFYVATAVDSGGSQSVYSNEAPAVIPTP